MSGGILGSLLEPDMVRRRALADTKTALFAFIGPTDFVENLSEDQRRDLAAAALGVGRDGLELLTEYMIENVFRDQQNIEAREQLRERTWALERKIIEQLAPELEAEHARALTKTTRKLYARDEQHFAAFCQELGVPSMPTSAAALAAYILDGSQKPRLLRRRLSAIAAWHRRKGYFGPVRDPLVRVALRHVFDAEDQPAATLSPAGQQEARHDG